MIRFLNFKRNGHLDGIISGDDMRDIIEVFPELKDSFKQRKSFDEYYFDSKEVFIDIERLQQLNDKWYDFQISSDNIFILT